MSQPQSDHYGNGFSDGYGNAQTVTEGTVPASWEIDPNRSTDNPAYDQGFKDGHDFYHGK